MSKHTYTEIIEFWFSEPIKKLWFNSTTDFDEIILSKYNSLWEQASRGQFKHWCDTPLGALSLAIILDQFPLNMFRGKAKSFSTEAQAIGVTRDALAKNFDKQLNNIQLPFLYMPLMHSENIDDQNDSVTLFMQTKLEDNLRFAKHHRDIIKKFGRFPHRNSILERTNSIAEIEYLNSPQAFKG